MRITLMLYCVLTLVVGACGDDETPEPASLMTRRSPIKTRSTPTWCRPT